MQHVIPIDCARPIVRLQHFTGGLDHWDPMVTDGLAAYRDVILVDNAGVGAPGGKTPPTIEGMADCIRAFVDALELTTFDLLGFAMGAWWRKPMPKGQFGKLGRLILVGTSPRDGDLSPFLADVQQRARRTADEDDMAWKRSWLR